MTIDGAADIARFRWLPLPFDIVPGVLSAVVEHLTPQLVFHPSFIDHPNGLSRISRIWAQGDRTASRSMSSTSQYLEVSLPPSIENEIPDSRVNLNIAGNDYYKVQVQGELSVRNHRGTPAILAVRRSFSGELREADDKPQSQLLETGVYSINKRYEMVWALPLKGGEEVKLKYSYTVLVLN